MTKKFTTDSPSIEEIQKLKRPNTRSVTLILDPEIPRQIRELERAYDRERRTDERENRPAKAPAIRKVIEELKDQAADSEITFTFRDIGRKRFDGMIEEHPPTPAQIKAAKERNQSIPEFNPDTFAPALMAATAVSPSMTLQEATNIYNEWGQGDNQALFLTAVAACTERASIPFTGTGTEEILASLSNLTTAPSEESPTDGSLEEPGNGDQKIELNL